MLDMMCHNTLHSKVTPHGKVRNTWMNKCEPTSVGNLSRAEQHCQCQQQNPAHTRTHRNPTRNWTRVDASFEAPSTDDTTVQYRQQYAQIIVPYNFVMEARWVPTMIGTEGLHLESFNTIKIHRTIIYTHFMSMRNLVSPPEGKACLRQKYWKYLDLWEK
jgi:hypothetical protein